MLIHLFDSLNSNSWYDSEATRQLVYHSFNKIKNI